MSPSPLAAAIVGVESLERSAEFYAGIVGLEPGPVVELEGRGFESHWQLPAGARARGQAFRMPQTDVGRVVLIEFAAHERRQIRARGEATTRGLWNLNFYVDDIRATSLELAARGHALWSEPVGYELSERSGAPIEVLFDGPDGIAINLVQLTGDARTTIGRLRREVDAIGRTRTGWSAVATTSHSVRDADAALRFYREVLGLRVLFDEVLDKAETNRFLRRPAGARTRATFVTADHPLGKIALSQPLNYEVPDRVELAIAPNIGYLAQSFAVTDLERAIDAARRCGGAAYSPAHDVDAWAQGRPGRAALVRNPGSGALMQLVQDERAR